MARAETVSDRIAGIGDVPRRNGEPVFEQPWQSRAFGMVVALAENRTCDYEEFRLRLIAAIGRWDAQQLDQPGAVYRYYDHWLSSLERLIVERGLLRSEEIEARARSLHEQDHHDHD